MKSIASFFLPLILCLATQLGAQASIESPGHEVRDSANLEMNEVQQEMVHKMANAQLTSMITKADNERFGYYIFGDGHLLIRQISIPAVLGRMGFVTEKEAQKVADLVIDKIKAGEIPPSVSMEELQVLDITMESGQ